jgi:hypothetical protein
VQDKEFAKLNQACHHTLNGLHVEAHQTLNLLTLVKLFPGDVERETALHLQRGKEKKVRAAYQRQRRDLFARVTSVDSRPIRKRQISRSLELP